LAGPLEVEEVAGVVVGIADIAGEGPAGMAAGLAELRVVALAEVEAVGIAGIVSIVTDGAVAALGVDNACSMIVDLLG
jgi:hypothetical protein